MMMRVSVLCGMVAPPALHGLFWRTQSARFARNSTAIGIASV